ncbi:snRNA-activating protein complex subunit 5-like [Hippopotamus amphibius kiboko]|uniref:snRNA-activating protein complex subunit 5-like n=1 Tax=Hippopotamus amphibius kiboko TaxID=575201 RepID=UPI00259232A2|nr:snRNA-activating protein complex subunit 5-like [Hippopotamus amphibius kiboko]
MRLHKGSSDTKYLLYPVPGKYTGYASSKALLPSSVSGIAEVASSASARRAASGRGAKLSRLQALREAEETRLHLKAAQHDQLNRLKSHDMLVRVDSEASINPTALELSPRSHVPEEEKDEEEEESDS